MRPSHLPLKNLVTVRKQKMCCTTWACTHWPQNQCENRGNRQRGHLSKAFFLKRQKRMFGGSKLHGLSQNHTANSICIYIYTHIIYIYSFIVVQHHFVGRAMAKSCQRQSRHGRTQRFEQLNIILQQQ